MTTNNIRTVDEGGPPTDNELYCSSRSCLNIFTPIRDWQIYCSEECGARERYERWKARDLERRGQQVKKAIEQFKALKKRRVGRGKGVGRVGTQAGGGR